MLSRAGGLKDFIQSGMDWWCPMHDWNREADMFEAPEYPEEWTSEQRLAAYWHALHFTGMPGDTSGWHAVWKEIEREQARRANR